MSTQILNFPRTGDAYARDEHHSAPIHQHGHAGSQPFHSFERSSTNFERLDVVPAGLPGGPPGRVFTFRTDVVDGEFPGSTAECGDLAGNLRTDRHGREFALAHVEDRPHVVEIYQSQDRET